MATHRHHSQAVVVLVVTLTLGLAAAAEAVEFAGGTGEPNDPYRIATAEQLVAIGSDPNLLDKHFILDADIDLDPNLPGSRVLEQAVIRTFAGALDGNDHTISHLTIRDVEPSLTAEATACMGFLGVLNAGAEVKSLTVADVNIVSSANFIGGLAGSSYGSVVHCSSTASVTGTKYIGGLTGCNVGTIATSYSAGAVTGQEYVGGLTGWGGAINSFWDVQTSGQAGSAGGAGKTTAEMRMASTYLNAQPELLFDPPAFWDFENTWTICEGKDYPRLQWEGMACGGSADYRFFRQAAGLMS